MLVPLKTRLRALLPAWAFFPLHSVWHRIARTPHVRIARRFASAAGRDVRAGPFAGMRYVDIGSGSSLVPKLVGCYERELHGHLERLMTRSYSIVVNIGCGEGYYAVGLARRQPEAHVIASDTAPSARALCSRLARANDVDDRIEIVGATSPADVAALAGPATLFVVDCEGCENDLLDPWTAPGLAEADLVVELHDFVAPGTAARITGWFTPTHHVDIVATEPRDPSEHGALEVLPPRDRAAALDEGRPGPMQWAVCRSRAAWPA